MKSIKLLSLLVVTLLVVWLGLKYFVGSKVENEGKALYDALCVDCHGVNGEGFQKLYPPIAGTTYWQQDTFNLVCLIKNGMERPIEINGVRYEGKMTGFPKLTNVEIANVINYLHKTWGGDKQSISPSEVKQKLSTCK